MKLIYCIVCKDIVLLHSVERTCLCGMSGGQYTDSVNAEIWGSSIPLGIANPSFKQALINRPDSGMGSDFAAFVIPLECSSIHRK